MLEGAKDKAGKAVVVPMKQSDLLHMQVPGFDLEALKKGPLQVGNWEVGASGGLEWLGSG